MDEITRMQDNLLLIRRIVGWTAEEFGEKIGVTRQTINNLEAKRSKLTKTQYIAMRSVLDAEIVRSPEDTKVLCLLLEVFVDHPEKYEKNVKQELLNKVNLIAPSILAGTATRGAVSKELLSGAIAGVIASALYISCASNILPAFSFCAPGAWLMKLVSGEEKSNR